MRGSRGAMLSHRFVTEIEECALFVKLPHNATLDSIELDIACEAVRIKMPNETTACEVEWPVEVAGRLDVEKSHAKFSRKASQLVVRVPLLPSLGVDQSGAEGTKAQVSDVFSAKDV